MSVAVVDLLMPKLGLTMTEGVVSQWSCQPGGRFAPGDILLVVETEKIANDVEATASGVLREILVPEGETVPVGAPIARWEPDGAVKAAAAPVSSQTAAAPTGREEGRQVADLTSRRPEGARVVATPYARRLAAERGIDIPSIAGRGEGGRIRAADVLAASANGEPDAPAVSVPEAEPAFRGGGKLVQPTGYQRSAARRLSAAKRDTPHFYLSAEVDVGELLGLRQKLVSGGGIERLTLTPLFLLAMAQALREEPNANRVWSDDGIVAFDTVDVGLAVHTHVGLLVPMLRDAGSLTLRQIAAEASRLTTRTRAGDLSLDDFGGGAATLSNGGMFDVTYMSSIITPGQSSILGVGSVRSVFRPDVEGRPILRQEIGLVLSCDHRVFDGVLGLRLLSRIRGYLQDPLSLLIR
ncbi:MAG: 2-oxo acid dehydrogenase subunit E2 [Phenylobacterium sp.]|uniref:dihydrolipoamide acetyltransferase family protein n=1 Tax=Phenylobacterium sp. TaxID=1871053 RepID=UPI0025F44098|nr:dihydrolipoamide acetyltransferase family protein [Phenylobacterium sp.]MBI1198683.1 2-oxo acid dehydrogenase subunit E2 [Phenylobacterium sp.]